jgi:hypothetical protein
VIYLGVEDGFLVQDPRLSHDAWSELAEELCARGCDCRALKIEIKLSDSLLATRPTQDQLKIYCEVKRVDEAEAFSMCRKIAETHLYLYAATLIKWAHEKRHHCALKELLVGSIDVLQVLRYECFSIEGAFSGEVKQLDIPLDQHDVTKAGADFKNLTRALGKEYPKVKILVEVPDCFISSSKKDYHRASDRST